MNISDKEKEIIFTLYPEFNQLTEYPVSRDGRYRVRLFNVDTKKHTTRQRAKLLLEVKLNRRLVDGETVDHIDENKSNDHRDNLQLLSRKDNASKGAKGNKNCLGYTQSDEHRRSGSKNGMAKLSDDAVLYFRRKFKNKELSKEQIMLQSGLSDKGVRNMLFGISYKSVGEFCIPRQKRS